jgi:hypothetical protein
VRRLSFKTQFKIEFLGPFYFPKKSLKKPLLMGSGHYLRLGLAPKKTFFLGKYFADPKMIRKMIKIVTPIHSHIVVCDVTLSVHPHRAS